MPCMKCKNGKYKWGFFGDCKYDSLEECERANKGKEMLDLSVDGIVTYPHIASRLFNTPLAIEPQKLRAIIASLDKYVKSKDANVVAVPRNSSIVDFVGESAIIHVHGTLVRKNHWVNAASGLTSYESIMHGIDVIQSRSDVKKIILDIDSPGGEAIGLHDVADALYGLRSKYEMEAYANGLAASAAYMLGATAHKFFVMQDGVVGSIGVVMEHVDTTGADKMRGIKVTPIYSGKFKVATNPHKELDEETYNMLKAHVDSFYDAFVSKLAKYRKMSDDVFRHTEGRLYVGQEAVEARLVDGVRSFKEVVMDEKSILELEEQIAHLREELSLRDSREKQLQEQLEQMQKVMMVNDLTAWVKENLKSLPGKVEDHVRLIMSVESLGSDVAMQLKNTLVNAAKLIDSGETLRVFGSDKDTEALSPVNRLQQRINALVKQGKSYTEAYATVMKESADDYAQYLKEV